MKALRFILIACLGGFIAAAIVFPATVAPTYTPNWNAEDERGFPWLARYVGRHTWTDTRHSGLRAFAQNLGDLSAILPEYFELLRTCPPSYWKSFHSFVAHEIARQPKPG